MKKRKPTRRASSHYGPWHVMLASPDKPMRPERYRHQLTRMHLALANITKGESPTDDDWRLIADAINLVETSPPWPKPFTAPTKTAPACA